MAERDPEQDPGGFVNDEELAFAIQAMMRKLRRRMRDEVDRGGITPSQVAVISRLDRLGPASASDLARAEGVRIQSMSATISVLTELGMVEGRPDPEDGRRTILEVTQSCRDWLEKDRAVRQSWVLFALHKTLNQKERKQLAEALPLLERIGDA